MGLQNFPLSSSSIFWRNRKMHSRNRYALQTLDYVRLRKEYPPLERFLESPTSSHNSSPTSPSSSLTKEKLHLNFKDPRAARALTCAILWSDWKLRVEYPLDSLCPTVGNKSPFWMPWSFSNPSTNSTKLSTDVSEIEKPSFPLFLWTSLFILILPWEFWLDSKSIGLPSFHWRPFDTSSFQSKSYSRNGYVRDGREEGVSF